jgi:voltage-gated potassium channel
MTTAPERADAPPIKGGPLRRKLHGLYYGDRQEALRFRLAILAVDLAIIGFFVAAPFLVRGTVFYALDYAIAALLAVDLAARGWAHGDLKRWARRPIVWVDLAILVSLLFPFAFYNFGFLRVLRLWTLVHTELFWRTVSRGRFDDTRVEDITKAGVNLFVFVFIATGFVYASFAKIHSGINSYLDALYFTITALTTTGFGDITLPGVWGKWLSIIIMIVGITLFVRLGQALLRPDKVRFSCWRCGLMRHDYDAVHCKACGATLAIPNDEA